MGLLDQLKQQAEQAKKQRGETASAVEDSVQLINGKLDRIFHYFRELAEQLQVIEPDTPLVFPVHSVGEMSNLKLREFSADYRRKTAGNAFSDLIDRVTLTFNYSSPQKFVVERTEIFQIERLKEYLGRYALRFDLEEKKNERGIITAGVFVIPWEVRALVHVRGDDRQRRIIFITRNVERLGEQEFVFDAEKVDETLLDEFARFLMGQPNHFRNLQ